MFESDFYGSCLPFLYASVILYPFLLGYFMFRKSTGILCLDFVSITGTTNPFFKHDKYVVHLKEFADELNDADDDKPAQHDFETLYKHYNARDDPHMKVTSELMKRIVEWKRLNHYDRVVIFYYTNCHSNWIEAGLNSRNDCINTLAISSLYGKFFPNRKFIDCQTKNDTRRYNRSERLLSAVLREDYKIEQIIELIV